MKKISMELSIEEFKAIIEYRKYELKKEISCLSDIICNLLIDSEDNKESNQTKYIEKLFLEQLEKVKILSIKFFDNKKIFDSKRIYDNRVNDFYF